MHWSVGFAVNCIKKRNSESTSQIERPHEVAVYRQADMCRDDPFSECRHGMDIAVPYGALCAYRKVQRIHECQIRIKMCPTQHVINKARHTEQHYVFEYRPTRHFSDF